MKRLWRDYGLSITLGLLFLVSFVGHTVSGYYEYAADQREHGSEPTILGDDGYGWVWAEWTLQNWQSEFLELTTFVVLSSFLIHKGSPESGTATTRCRRRSSGSRSVSTSWSSPTGRRTSRQPDPDADRPGTLAHARRVVDMESLRFPCGRGGSVVGVDTREMSEPLVPP